MDSLNPQFPDPKPADDATSRGGADPSPAHRYDDDAAMFASGDAPIHDLSSAGAASDDFSALIGSLEALEYDIPAGLADRVFIASAARLPSSGRDSEFDSTFADGAHTIPFRSASTDARRFSVARFARSVGPALAMAAVIGVAFVLSTRDNRGSAWDGISDGARAGNGLATASISPISFEGSPSEAVLAALLRTPEDADQWPAASLVSHASTRDVISIVELRETSLDDLLAEFSRIESHASRPVTRR